MLPGASWPQAAVMRRAPSPALSEACRGTPSHGIATRTLTLGEAVEALWPRPQRIAMAPATPAERAGVLALTLALRGSPPSQGQGDAGREWAERASGAGFALELWCVDGGAPCGVDAADPSLDAGWFWVLRERGAERRGHGTYVFRASPARGASLHGPAIIVQAPHAYFEHGTGALAAAVMFAAADAGQAPDALMTDSLHRYQQASGARARQIRNPADVCHEPTHLFQDVTAALADGGPAVFVQIHGFAVPGDGTPHGSRRTNYPEIIVSAGRRQGSTIHSTAVADAWAQLLGAAAVRRYPEEIGVLGGSTNVQARLLATRAEAAFVHVELSSSMRARLLADAGERAAWTRALLQALRCSLAQR
jgi:hypothetical protein